MMTHGYLAAGQTFDWHDHPELGCVTKIQLTLA